MTSPLTDYDEDSLNESESDNDSGDEEASVGSAYEPSEAEELPARSKKKGVSFALGGASVRAGKRARCASSDSDWDDDDDEYVRPAHKRQRKTAASSSQPKGKAKKKVPLPSAYKARAPRVMEIINGGMKLTDKDKKDLKIDGGYKCYFDDCDAMRERLGDLQRHLSSDRHLDGYRPFVCLFCMEEMTRDDALKRHLKDEDHREKHELLLKDYEDLTPLDAIAELERRGVRINRNSPYYDEVVLGQRVL
jgi:hypothetical protein